MLAFTKSEWRKLQRIKSAQSLADSNSFTMLIILFMPIEVMHHVRQEGLS